MNALQAYIQSLDRSSPDHRRWWCNSDPHRTMAYTITPEGDVRYPGDPIERRIAELDAATVTPVKITTRSRLRRSQKKEFSKKFKLVRVKVTAEDLDTRYADYVGGRVTFDEMWGTLSGYVLYKSQVEQNDFGTRKRDLSGDAVSTFLVGMRAGLVGKAFTGLKDSSYHNFVDRAWHRHKAGEFTAQKALDDRFVSAETPVGRDDEGQPQNALDAAWLDILSKAPTADYGGQLEALTLMCEDRLSPFEKAVLAEFAGGLGQGESATSLKVSRHVIGRERQKLVQLLRSLLPEFRRSQIPVSPIKQVTQDE